jgi:hypothetical protein
MNATGQRRRAPLVAANSQVETSFLDWPTPDGTRGCDVPKVEKHGFESGTLQWRLGPALAENPRSSSGCPPDSLPRSR